MIHSDCEVKDILGIVIRIVLGLGDRTGGGKGGGVGGGGIEGGGVGETTLWMVRKITT